MTKQEVLVKVLDWVEEGKFDQYLDMISHAVRSRRETIHQQTTRRNMLALSKAGTKVIVVGNIKPQYIRGHEGVVVPRPSAFTKKPKNDVIYVDFGAPIGRYGRIMGVPASCLEAA